MAYAEGQNNYGTSLQGYALLKVMRNWGYDIQIIHYIKRLTIKEKIEYFYNTIRIDKSLKVFFSKIFHKKITSTNHLQNIAIRTKSVNDYKKSKLIPYFKDYVGYKQLVNGSLNYDVIIVGSDQVWLPQGLPGKFFNLMFVKDSIRKVAYASSFGVKTIPEFQREKTKRYLERFYKIGVREQSGKEIVESISNQKAHVVVDPTLLLTREDWKKEIESSSVHEKEPYIFSYILSDNREALQAVQELKEKTGLKLIVIRNMERNQYYISHEGYGDEAPYNVDPNDFIKYISEATYVCTDSFHCSVFSLLFHRQVMTFYRAGANKGNSRNTRVENLYCITGVGRSHIFESSVNLDSIKERICHIDDEIDWNNVDSKIEDLRKESLGFLKSAII